MLFGHIRLYLSLLCIHMNLHVRPPQRLINRCRLHFRHRRQAIPSDCIDDVRMYQLLICQLVELGDLLVARLRSFLHLR